MAIVTLLLVNELVIAIHLNTAYVTMELLKWIKSLFKDNSR